MRSSFADCHVEAGPEVEGFRDAGLRAPTEPTGDRGRHAHRARRRNPFRTRHPGRKVAAGVAARHYRTRQRYGMGATPLREGLSRLVSHALMVASASAAFASPVSEADLRDITRMRVVVEQEALCLSMKLGKDDWEAGIVAALHRMQRHVERTGAEFSEGAEEFDPLHKRFHTALLEACDSPRLLAAHSDLYDQAYRYRRVMMRKFDSGKDFVARAPRARRLRAGARPAPAPPRLATHLNSTIEYVYPGERAEIVTIAADRRVAAPARTRRKDHICRSTLDLGGKTIVEDLNLTVRPGEFVCIVGASGCGKTTVLRLAAGLYQPTSGKVTFDGKPMTGRAATSRSSSRIMARRCCRGARRPATSRWRWKPRRADGRAPARIAALLEKVGLPGPRRQISGRDVRRHAAAAADRPLPGAGAGGAVDGRAVRRARCHDAAGLAGRGAVAGRGQRRHVLFVTHDLEEAIYLGDRVIGLLPHPGRIGIEVKVDLPRPRDQLTTREHPEFLRLRRELFDFIKAPSSDGVIRAKALVLPLALLVAFEVAGARHPSAKRQPGAAERDRLGARSSASPTARS